MVTVKRVVTGVDADGKSVFYEDAPLPAVEALPGAAFYQVWGSDRPVTAPVTEPGPEQPTFFPGPGGTRFGIMTVQPESAAPAEADPAAIAAALPGLLEVFDSDQPGMHQTKSLDYAFVAAGELCLELDDGAEVHLPTGSCVIQNGARHAWHNRGTTPATLVYVILGATT